MDDSIDLGNHFRYIQDYPQTIVYHASEQYEGVGDIIVTPIVKDFNFNDQYIIARSLGEQQLKGDTVERPFQYWIIDKHQKLNQVKPMDSLTFYTQLKNLGIELVFKGH